MQQCLPDFIEHFPLENFLTSVSAKQYVAVTGSAIIRMGTGYLRGGRKKKSTFLQV